MGLPRLVAAITPSQAPINVASSVPVPTSSSVQGSASLISVQTGWRVRWLMPEVEVQRVARVVDELTGERLVEPVVVPQLLDLLRRGPRQARQLGGGVAHHAEQEEVEDEDERERQQRRGDLAREPARIHERRLTSLELHRLAAAAAPPRGSTTNAIPANRTTPIAMKMPAAAAAAAVAAAAGAIVSIGS